MGTVIIWFPDRRTQATCSRSQSQWEAEPGVKPGVLAPLNVFLIPLFAASRLALSGVGVGGSLPESLPLPGMGTAVVLLVPRL